MGKYPPQITSNPCEGLNCETRRILSRLSMCKTWQETSIRNAQTVCLQFRGIFRDANYREAMI